MAKDQLDEFGRLLMAEIRDAVIDKWEAICSGSSKAPRLVKLSSTISEYQGKPEDLLRELFPEVVDSCLSRVLALIESSDDMCVTYRGTEIRADSDGLSGELYGDNGWIWRFSKHGKTKD